jgi:hypothetical protein
MFIQKTKVSMQSEIDDLTGEVRIQEERVRRACDDAARLAEELRSEQAHSSYEEANAKALEIYVAELENRLGMIESSSSREERRQVGQLEAKCAELERQLAHEKMRCHEVAKEAAKTSRRYKELIGRVEADRDKTSRQGSVIQNLTARLSSYRQRAEECEQESRAHLGRLLSVRRELEEREERAETVERQELKMKVLSRSSLSCSRSDLFTVS